MGVDGEQGLGLGAFIIVLPFFNNGRCSSCWGMLFTVEYCCWGLSSSLGIDKSSFCFLDGLWVWGLGDGIVDDMAVVGDIGVGRMT